MTKYSCLLSSLVSLLVCSCVSIDVVSIDYLQSARVSFPPEIKTVAILNNTIDKSDKSNIKSKSNNNGIPKIELTLQGDGKTTTEEFAKSVAAANYFDQVIICDSALREKDHFPRDQELTQQEVKQLTSDLGVDMLFSVEDVTIKAKQETTISENMYRATIDAKASPVIRVYLPSRSRPLVTVSPEDNVFWEEYGASEAEAKRNLINVDELIKEVSEFAGELPTPHLIPTWNNVDRYYYASGSLELRDASILIHEESWDDALKLWQLANTRKSDKLKMRSAFNIALYYESHDDIDKAIEWVEKAYQMAQNKEKKTGKTPNENKTTGNQTHSQDYLIAEQYLRILTARKAEIQTLNLQMKRFDSNF